MKTEKERKIDNRGREKWRELERYREIDRYIEIKMDRQRQRDIYICRERKIRE